VEEVEVEETVTTGTADLEVAEVIEVEHRRRPATGGVTTRLTIEAFAVEDGVAEVSAVEVIRHLLMTGVTRREQSLETLEVICFLM